MNRTPFAGLVQLDPGEGLAADGFSFTHENPSIIDRYLEAGAVSHLHDAHAALTNPVADPVVATLATGGALQADQALYVRYTLLDIYGGETVPSAAVQVTTPAALPTPSSGPALALDTSAGTLGVGTFLYALSFTDAAGGETPLGPATTIARPAGPANAQVQVSGLTALLTAAGATGWRLWRSMGGGMFGWIAAGSTNTYTDTGGTMPDCTIRPPTRNTTNGSNRLSVTVPNTQPAATVQFRIYVSLDGTFESPSVAGTYPIADAGTAKIYASLALTAGRPPSVSRSLPGAHKLNPETEIAGLRWRTPAANAAALPSAGNAHGDVRATLDDSGLHIWGLDDAWHSLAGVPTAWTALPYAADFVDPTGGPYGGGKYTKDAPEIVRLRGGVTRTTTPSFEGDIFATLPVGFRPVVAESNVVPYWDSSAAAWVRATVTVLPNGEMHIDNTGVGVGTLDIIVISGITFRTT